MPTDEDPQTSSGSRNAWAVWIVCLLGLCAIAMAANTNFRYGVGEAFDMVRPAVPADAAMTAALTQSPPQSATEAQARSLQPALQAAFEEKARRKLKYVEIPDYALARHPVMIPRLFFQTSDRKCSYAFVVTRVPADPVAGGTDILTAHLQYFQRKPGSKVRCPPGPQDFSPG